MKSFFKKLSLVLAAALVITMLPVQSAKAATKVSLGKDKASAAANTAQAFTFEVGDTEKWNFYGVTDYNAAGAKTKKWVSSNTAVATVANGQVTAVAAGKAKITFTVTNNGIDYIGTADVTVVEKNAQSAGAPVVKQVAWNEIDVIFDTVEEAKDAKDKIKVNRVKQSKTGSDIKLYVAFTKDRDKNVLKITGLSDKVTYEVIVPGYATPWTITMAVGDPVAVKLSYPTAYISTKKGVNKDISGKTISAPVVMPNAVVVDKNGIICESKSNGFTYTTDKTKNVGNVVVSSNGQITFREVNASAYVKCDYSYKDNNNKTIKIDYDEVTVSPTAYTTPNFQGFVEKITLTGKSGNEVVYPDDYSYTATLAVGQEQALAFYFETPDGDIYTPELVQSTVQGIVGSKKENTNVSVIKADGANYSYYAVKDDNSKAVVSIRTISSTNTKEVKIKGLSEGEETICIYERAEGTKASQQLTDKDKLVGVLTITVLQEPEVVSFNLDSNSVTGFYNTQLSEDRYLDIPYKLEDQYGNEITAKVNILDENKMPCGAISFLTTSYGTPDNYLSSGNGAIQKAGIIRIDVNHAQMRNLPTEGKTFIISTVLQKNPVSDSFIVSTSAIDTDSTDTGYGLLINTNNASLKNKNVRTVASTEARRVAINVVNTFENNRHDGNVDFYVVRDEDITATTGAAGQTGKLVVVITREDNTVLDSDIDGNPFLYVSEIGTSAATASEFFIASQNVFDLMLVKDQSGDAEATIDVNTLLKGTYNVTLYSLTAGAAPQYITSDTFTVTDAIDGIKQIDPRKQLFVHDSRDVDNKGKVMNTNLSGGKVEIWKESGNALPASIYPSDLISANSTTATTARKNLVKKIIDELYVWIDLDSNGSAVDSNGDAQDEVFQIKNLKGANHAAGVYYDLDSSKYIFGTDASKEVYIKYVTIQYRIDDGALITQTLDINTKYVFN